MSLGLSDKRRRFPICGPGFFEDSVLSRAEDSLDTDSDPILVFAPPSVSTRCGRGSSAQGVNGGCDPTLDVFGHAFEDLVAGRENTICYSGRAMTQSPSRALTSSQEFVPCSSNVLGAAASAASRSKRSLKPHVGQVADGNDGGFLCRVASIGNAHPDWPPRRTFAKSLRAAVVSNVVIRSDSLHGAVLYKAAPFTNRERCPILAGISLFQRETHSYSVQNSP